MNCEEARLSLGAYVVGALDATDRVGVDEHVATCERCRGELASLAGLPGLLGLLTPAEAVAGAVEPPPYLLDKLLARMAGERRHARVRRLVVAAAAAIAVLTSGVTTGVLVTHHGSTPPAAVAERVAATDPHTHVHVELAATKRKWGTEVAMTLTGVPSGEHCRLVVVARDGSRETVGSWEAAYDTPSVRVTMATALQVDQIARYEIVTFDGRSLVGVSA